jgi:hypothetical protein
MMLALEAIPLSENLYNTKTEHLMPDACYLNPHNLFILKTLSRVCSDCSNKLITNCESGYYNGQDKRK